MDLTVACVLYVDKEHTDFNLVYVEKLASTIRRNLTVPHKFVCYSNMDVRFFDRIPLVHDWPGWWSKMEVMDVARLPGRVLLADLDTVLVGNIDEMAKARHTTLIHGFHGRRAPMGSGFMMLTQDDRARLWQEFSARPKKHMENFRGDQDFISPRVQHARTWQEDFPGQLVSYKLDCVAKHKDVLPEKARVICFHGKPRPVEMPKGHWTYEHWC
jgi:hypothetical protein